MMCQLEVYAKLNAMSECRVEMRAMAGLNSNISTVLVQGVLMRQALDVSTQEATDRQTNKSVTLMYIPKSSPGDRVVCTQMVLLPAQGVCQGITAISSVVHPSCPNFTSTCCLTSADAGNILSCTMQGTEPLSALYKIQGYPHSSYVCLSPKPAQDVHEDTNSADPICTAGQVELFATIASCTDHKDRRQADEGNFACVAGWRW